MGSFFDQLNGRLTRADTALDYGDRREVFGSPRETLGAANQEIASMVPPFLQLGHRPPGLARGMASDPQEQVFLSGDPRGEDPRGEFSEVPEPLPRITRPSFREQTFDAAGNVKPGFQGLTKLGALGKILIGSAMGGLDAAQAGALDAVPGRSNFGFGLGAPERMAEVRREQYAKRQREPLETEKLRQEISDLPFRRLLRLGQIKRDRTQSELNQARTRKALEPKQALREEIEERKQVARDLGLAEGGDKFLQFVGKLTPERRDTSVSAYEDFRESYAQTPEGRKQAATDWVRQQKQRVGPSAGDLRDEDIAEAEDIAAQYVDQAGGDEDAAMELLERAAPRITNKRHRKLLPRIRSAIRGYRPRSGKRSDEDELNKALKELE